jgi:hypothetical protein
MACNSEQSIPNTFMSHTYNVLYMLVHLAAYDPGVLPN